MMQYSNLTTLITEEEIVLQVENDRKRLGDLAGYEIERLAYPCGGTNNNDSVAKIIKENQARNAREILAHLIVLIID